MYIFRTKVNPFLYFFNCRCSPHATSPFPLIPFHLSINMYIEDTQLNTTCQNISVSVISHIYVYFTDVEYIYNERQDNSFLFFSIDSFPLYSRTNEKKTRKKVSFRVRYFYTQSPFFRLISILYTLQSYKTRDGMEYSKNHILTHAFERDRRLEWLLAVIK